MKDKIIYNIASYKRADTLIKTIESIYDQCDIINVALNDYDSIPFELYDPKINLFITDNDRGDAYKFYKLMDSEGYFFTIDDDLIYPENYTEYMVNKVNEYGRKSIITLHARSFQSFPITSFYGRNTIVNHFKHINTEDCKVQFGGTGVMCFHTDLFKVPIEYFDRPNMADVWIGKYSKENNIDIICARHTKDYVIQQDFEGSIYNKDLREDGIQTNLTNECYLDKKISVIIPTFDNVDYLQECLDSVVKSCGNLQNFEILVGVDCCPKTLKFIQDNTFDLHIKFFYFKENIGPYIIKNTLAKLSKSNNVIFFDSDDVMNDIMINEILSHLEKSECVKPMYHNFSDKIDYDDPKYTKYSNLFGEGVFGIRKNIFLNLNGFEGWRCAADSDFMVRLQKNGVTFKLTNNSLFYRRIHLKGLTSSPETNYGSKLRKHYVELSKAKTDFGPLKELTISEFDVIYNKLKIEKKYFLNPPKVVKEIIPIDNTKVLDKVVVEKHIKKPEILVVTEEPLIEDKTIETKNDVNTVKDNILNLLSGYKPTILKTPIVKDRPKIPVKVVIPPTIKETLSNNKDKKSGVGVTVRKGGGFNF